MVMDVTEYQGELTRAHWDLLLDADPSLDMVLAYTPPQLPEAEIFIIGEPKTPYAMCVVIPVTVSYTHLTLPTKA